MTSSIEFFDIRTPPAEEIHEAGCECPSCESGVHSVPMDQASSEDFARYVLGKATAYADIRQHALAVVREAREHVPDTSGWACPTWENAGHSGHHWYIGADKSFICACGARGPVTA